MKLRPKFISGMVLFVVLPVVAMGIFTYVAFSNLVEQKAATYFRLALQDADRMLNFAMKEINSVTDFAIIQDGLQDLLKYPPGSVTSVQKKELNSYIMLHTQITSFTLYNNSKMVYQTDHASVNIPFETLVKLDLYKEAIEMNGRPLWIAPGENNWSTNRNGELLVIRKIRDYHTLEDIGTLLVTVKADLLDQVFWEASVDGDIILLNEDGQIAYSKSGRLIGDFIANYGIGFNKLSNNEYVIQPFIGESSFIASIESARIGWNIVAVTPEKHIFQEVQLVRNIVIVVIMFLVMMAFLFEKLFISKLVQTILKTVRGLRQVEEGNFREITEIKQNNDEVGLLIYGFNSMSRQIKDLIAQVEREQSQKKEAEMSALVAQINPHFIYNSLESINSLAILHGNRDISRMVVSLGKLLRISISENKELIPLYMELEHIDHYMRIQKYRFEDQFEFKLEMREDLKYMMTQKLIIQPIVENSLYHAIEQMSEKGEIIVKVIEDNNDIVIFVIDNGPGFAHQELLRLSEIYSKNSANSRVGIKNVHNRLSIRFGQRYGVIVCSAKGFGTTVQIRIPKIVTEERIGGLIND